MIEATSVYSEQQYHLAQIPNNLMMPNQMGSKPAARISGNVMGKLITVMDIPSRNMPSST